MKLHQPLDDKKYQELKEKNLENLLGKYCSNITWIWIGGASRRKVNFQIDAQNNLGFFAEKTHDLVEIHDDTLLEKEIVDFISPLKNFLKTQEHNLYTQASITLFDNGLDVVLASKRELNFTQTQKLTNFAKEKNINISNRIKNHLTPIYVIRKNQIFYPDFKIDLDSEIFLQATKSGLENIIKVIRQHVKNLRVVDIYAGFGAYSFAIQDLVKSVFAFEGDEKMVDSITKNAAANKLSNKIKAQARDLFVDPLTKTDLRDFDLAILNPPRNGASPQAVEITKSNLKNLIYVSCNPESFARDAKILIDCGFKISSVTAIDQFYSTKHLELVAILTK